MVEQAATAGESMLSQSQDMSVMMEFFTVSESAEAIKSPVLKTTKTAKKAVTKRRRKAEPPPEEDDIQWDEF
ncbi:hypothetical protein [Enterovibrio coralii]|uniref:hypothetical protein n=1 Tax=Enterovibrio coralii TaxID=294935 RepID=UPI001E616E89|nr:hypothetical protein [Enterovibrio coralii]